MINKREEYLLFILTISLLTTSSGIDFGEPFFVVLVSLIAQAIITLILAAIFYSIATKPFYKWVVKKLEK